MDTKEKLKSGQATTKEALEIFDSLETVGIDFMMGSWQGRGFHTGHPMDGLLEAYQWHGKRFENPEDVHPLVFSNRQGGLVSVNPKYAGPFLGLADRVPFPKAPVFGRIFQFLLPLVTTTKSRARLRMTSYRGEVTATMIYDQLPINDVFRKIDDNSVFGAMDLKGMGTPFFFRLDREGSC